MTFFKNNLIYFFYEKSLITYLVMKALIHIQHVAFIK